MTPSASLQQESYDNVVIVTFWTESVKSSEVICLHTKSAKHSTEFQGLFISKPLINH